MVRGPACNSKLPKLALDAIDKTIIIMMFCTQMVFAFLNDYSDHIMKNIHQDDVDDNKVIKK